MSEDVKPTGHDQSFYVEVNRLVTKEHLGSQLCFIDSTADFGISTLDPNGSNSSLPSEVLAVLKLEVNSCTQLVELEPNNRWPLLNLLFIQRAIQNDLPNEQMINLLEQLKRADKKRLRFYDDLRSRYLIEDKLKMEQQNGQLETLSLNGM